MEAACGRWARSPECAKDHLQLMRPGQCNILMSLMRPLAVVYTDHSSRDSDLMQGSCKHDSDVCARMTKQHQRFQQYMLRSSCRPAVKKDLLRDQPTAFTLQVLNSGLAMAEAHAMDEKCIARAPAHRPLCNIVHGGAAHQEAQGVGYCEIQTMRETGTAGLRNIVTRSHVLRALQMLSCQ